jgi:hypothetical protein
MIKAKTLNLILLFFIFSIIAIAQEVKKNTNFNFARIIQYEVVLKKTIETDTSLIKKTNNNESKNTPISYLDESSFNQFIKVIKKYLNDKNAFAILQNKKVSTDELRKVIFRCDSVYLVEYDNTGKEILKKKFVCDDKILDYDVSKIEFTESWTIDPISYELKKEVLAFSLMVYSKKYEAFWTSPKIYKNQKAFELINNMISN